MTTSSLLLLTLFNTNSMSMMSNLFDLNYLTVQEKNKLLEIKKQECDNKRKQKIQRKAMMVNINSNKSKYYNRSNYNITKEYKR
jgi:hypothetical protein